MKTEKNSISEAVREQGEINQFSEPSKLEILDKEPSLIYEGNVLVIKTNFLKANINDIINEIRDERINQFI